MKEDALRRKQLDHMCEVQQRKEKSEERRRLYEELKSDYR